MQTTFALLIGLSMTQMLKSTSLTIADLERHDHGTTEGSCTSTKDRY